MPPVWRMVDVIIPQLMRISLPSIVSYAIGLLKDTAIASTIGIPEIAFKASCGSPLHRPECPIASASRVIDKRLRARGAK